MGGAAGACRAYRVVRTADAAHRSDASSVQLVPATAQRVFHSFARLPHPGPNLVDDALLAKSGVPCRVTDAFFRATDHVVELVLGFSCCTHACSVSAAQQVETWLHGKLPASRPRSSGDRARLS
jgi:hypothetical protein